MSETDYSVTISRNAQKEIRDLDAPVIPRIMTAIRRLASDPRPPGCKKLTAERGLWRIRVGDYRVVYAVDDAARTVKIVVVRHRSAAYE
jgi:mRNA interferase RelE/StbE